MKLNKKRKQPIIYVILVTYNPSIDDLIQNINKLLNQKIFKILIMDNSDNKSLSTKIAHLKSTNIEVKTFGENLGIAKAQSIGMKWAFENGADFILQMDQDSIPSDDLVEKLLECYEKLSKKGYKIGLVGPQDFDKDTKELNKARLKKGVFIENFNYVSVEQTLSSGSLIPKHVYDIVGGMDDKLFIDAVDSEYCWRIRKKGFLVIKNNDALLAHKLGNGEKKIFGFLNVGVPNPIRHYYQTRNTLLLLRRDYVPTYWKCSGIIKILFKLVVYPFTLNQGFERFKYIIKGIKDGILGKSGKIS